MASADTRSTHTDALTALGTIIDNTIGRDAIHLAVEPMVAITRLKPGQQIGLTAEGHPVSTSAKMCVTGYLGIVDPFLNNAVEAGQRFLMVLKPGQIATLRHVWDHPAFPPALVGGVALGVPPAAAPAASAKEWLTQYASAQCISYEDLIRDTLRWSHNDDEPWWVDSSQDYDTFWEKMDNLLGYKLARGYIDMTCRGC